MVYTISDGPATKKLKQGVSDGVMTITIRTYGATIRGFATTIRNQRLLRYADATKTKREQSSLRILTPR